MMPKAPTNLQVIKRSRTRPRAGDIFTMKLPGATYIFGRVIAADLEEPHEAPMPGVHLIYVYRHRVEEPIPDMSTLTPIELLLPPVFINRMPWTKGYFENLDHADLKPNDLVAMHCFWDVARKIYVDEKQNALPHETHPCGDWALSSYRWLDDQVSDALGIPRVPEEA